MLETTSILKSIYPLFSNKLTNSLIGVSSEKLPKSFDRPRLSGPVTAPCFQSFSDGSSVTISYLLDTNEVQYIANVTATSYFALGYGSNMINTDMVAWIANGSASYQ